MQWLKDGDSNTKNFHQSTIQRRRKINNVVTLKNSTGDWVDNPSLVRRMVDEHFMDLFKSSGQWDWGDVLNCVSPKVTYEMNLSLSGTVMIDEVKCTVMIDEVKCAGM